MTAQALYYSYLLDRYAPHIIALVLIWATCSLARSWAIYQNSKGNEANRRAPL